MVEDEVGRKVLLWIVFICLAIQKVPIGVTNLSRFGRQHRWFLGTQMYYETIALTIHKRKFLFAALRRFFLGAARLVVFRLIGCLRRNGLARCWDGSVSLDVWGKYSRSPCSFLCLVIGESRRYLHYVDQRWNES